MIANWFEAKVKYIKISEDGRERKVNELYLLDAFTHTEAEARIIEEMKFIVSGDYYIAGLKRSNISEIVPSDDENDDKWYKIKVAFIDADDVSGKEKKSNQYYLVAGSDTKRAQENLEKSLASFVVPYEIVAINDTMFLDVFPYKAKEEGDAEENEGDESECIGQTFDPNC
ncbi:MAG: DUF4494 domain-containing protein [Marinifilaceae bacterium]